MTSPAPAHPAADPTAAPSALPPLFTASVQVEIAVNFVFRACAPLAGQPVPSFGEHRESLATLQARVEAAQAFLHTLQPHDFAAAAERTIHDPAGETTVALDGSTFLQQYALPNFFFHLSMVYALLRQQGLPLSKGDFDGWHVYRG